MTSVILQCVVAVLLIAGALAGAGSVVMIVMLFCYLAGIGFISPNTTALAIEPFASRAGTASALLGGIQMTAGALASALVSYFHDGTALPMAAALLLSSMVSLGLQVQFAERTKRTV